MVPRARPAAAAVLGGVLALAFGCSESGSGPVPLDQAAGAVLADRADRLADALAAGAPCRALDEADALRERAAQALADGEAPESVVEETTRVVDAATADLACDEPDDDAGDTETDGDQEVDEADAADEPDVADETDDAPTETSPAPSPSPAPEPAPDPSPDPEPSPADDASSGRGPDGDGPPGQDRGGGGGPPDEPPGQGRGRG